MFSVNSLTDLLGDKQLGHGHLVPHYSHLGIVQHLHKEEVSHLFQDGYGVGDAASPEGIPVLINAVLYFASNHIVSFNYTRIEHVNSLMC